jgi:Pvc16 N-terminal domain
MIHNALRVIADNLDQYLGNRFSQSSGIVEITPLGDAGEGAQTGSRERLSITLVNIEQEKLGHKPNSHIPSLPVTIYLYIIIAADYPENNYEEALKLISAAIGFFQSNAVFNHQNTGNLDPSIDKLVFEMVSLSIQELSQLWSINGGKYLPSVVYKVRMINIEDGILDHSSIIAGFGNKML